MKKIVDCVNLILLVDPFTFSQRAAIAHIDAATPTFPRNSVKLPTLLIAATRRGFVIRIARACNSNINGVNKNDAIIQNGQLSKKISKSQNDEIINVKIGKNLVVYFSFNSKSNKAIYGFSL